MSDFMPGLELNRIFYIEAVKPILDREFPALQYSAALIGSGSRGGVVLRRPRLGWAAASR